ncbi:MAG: 30S ribosomal protein S17 [Candidatus Omnitrophica bacterium]|nr:30S ribosomal protein S17 [Candidatus Omnitrophota bacterium]
MSRQNLRKERTGIVVSDKMQKTIVVQVWRKAPHPDYGKVIEKAAKFKVHDEKNQAKVGDRVRIVETRPLSKDKRWRLVEVLAHGHGNASVDLKETV